MSTTFTYKCRHKTLHKPCIMYVVPVWDKTKHAFQWVYKVSSFSCKPRKTISYTYNTI